jgi:hypothetical protein
MLAEVDWGSPRADSIQIAATETRRDSAIRRQRVPQLGLRRRLYPGVQQRPANIAEPLVTPLAWNASNIGSVRWAECQVREDEE